MAWSFARRSLTLPAPGAFGAGPSTPPGDRRAPGRPHTMLAHGLQHSRSAAPRSAGFRAVPSQVMRGSRRNHLRWRRANWRVRAPWRPEPHPRRGFRRRPRAPPGSRWPGPRSARARRGTGARAPCASSTRPVSHVVDPRVDPGGEELARQPDPEHAHRERRSDRSGRAPTPNDENGRPVSSITSSARTMRRRLPGSMRAAAAGSRCSQLGVQRVEAVRLVGASVDARRGSRRPRRGTGDRRRPPARRGRCRRRAARAAPRLDVATAARAARWNCAHRPFVGRVGDVDEVVRHRARSSAVGFAVPMSRPR